MVAIAQQRQCLHTLAAAHPRNPLAALYMVSHLLTISYPSSAPPHQQCNTVCRITGCSFCSRVYNPALNKAGNVDVRPKLSSRFPSVALAQIESLRLRLLPH